MGSPCFFVTPCCACPVPSEPSVLFFSYLQYDRWRMLLASGIILLLILLTALYVAAEFAAVGVRRSRLRRLADDGNPLAARLLPVLEDPQALDRYIAVSQVGITLCSLILGAYAQADIAPRVAPLVQRLGGLDADGARSASAVVVLLALTTLAMILGELVPKSVALQNPTRTALITVVPMQWSERVFSWSIHFLNGGGMLLLKLMGVRSTGHRHVHSPEEIELLIAESRDGGLLEPQEQVRLHQALRLGLRTAKELMIPRDQLAAVDVSTAFPEVLRVVATSPYSRLPVYRGSLDDVVGIIHTKDVVTAFIERGERTSLTALTRPVARVHHSLPADHLLTYLRDRHIQQALVVGDGGFNEGLVTLEDVVAELLGGVSDEFKIAPANAILLPDGSVRLPGAMRLDQAAHVLGAPWTGPGDTVAEFIAATLGSVPAPGEHVTVGGVNLVIEAVAADGVSSVLVLPPSTQEAQR
jgi:putative hemolysin